MTGFALLLLIAAAITHATWNLLAKRAGGGAVFVWFYAGTSSLLWAPIALPAFIRALPKLGHTDWIFLFGSGLIHLLYFIVLQKAYRTGDLSLVYPVARGTGPALSTATAIMFLGERPTPAALVGSLFVSGSVMVFSKPTCNSGAARKQAISLGIATGVLIACYTLWDKHAVASRGIPPLVMEWFTSITRSLLLFPLAFNNWDEVVDNWRMRRKYAIWIGILNPLAYICVLLAMTFTPVSYVAPAREMSVLFGAVLGGHVLHEGDRARRVVAASIMLLGVILLSLN